MSCSHIADAFSSRCALLSSQTFVICLAKKRGEAKQMDSRNADKMASSRFRMTRRP